MLDKSSLRQIHRGCTRPRGRSAPHQTPVFSLGTDISRSNARFFAPPSLVFLPRPAVFENRGCLALSFSGHSRVNFGEAQEICPRNRGGPAPRVVGWSSAGTS